MEPFKPRTKIKVLIGKSVVIFSGNKKGSQIATLACSTEVRASRLSTAFRFKADGYRPVELSFDKIRETLFVVTLTPK